MKLFFKSPACALSVSSLLVLQGGFQLADAHYGFPFVMYNGVMSGRWEYTRPSTTFWPNFDYQGPDVICGFNGTKPLFPVKTLKVEAGSLISVGSAISHYSIDNYDESKDFEPWSGISALFHEGPGNAYLSKAPDSIQNLNDYAGDGDWFKIGVIGSSDGMRWDAGILLPLMNFTIPKATPPGKYLFRTEHLFMNTRYMQTQMYISCTHMEISGPGGGKPGPTKKFPGYDPKDRGIQLPKELYWPGEPNAELLNWQGAGPPVWRGE